MFYQWLLLAPLALVLGCSMGSQYDRLVIDTFMPDSGIFQNDTYLTLIDSAGNLVAQDDNGNPDQVNHNLCSRIDLPTGLSSGTYYIKVHRATATGNPNYCIRVLDYDPGASFPTESRANEDETIPVDDAVNGSGVPIDPVSISLGGVISRSIFPESDVDWYELVLP